MAGGAACRGGTDGRRRCSGVAGILRAPAAGGSGLPEYGSDAGCDGVGDDEDREELRESTSAAVSRDRRSEADLAGRGGVLRGWRRGQLEVSSADQRGKRESIGNRHIQNTTEHFYWMKRYYLPF